MPITENVFLFLGRHSKKLHGLGGFPGDGEGGTFSNIVAIVLEKWRETLLGVSSQLVPSQTGEKQWLLAWLQREPSY